MSDDNHQSEQDQTQPTEKKPATQITEFESETSSPSTFESRKKKSERVVLIVGGIFLILVIVIPLILMIPDFRQEREATRRSAAKHNLKNLALVLHNYYDEQGTFPPGATETPEGLPLHSWQTAILPYIDELNLYQRIDLEQPWNADINKPHFQKVISYYLIPGNDLTKSADGYGLTHYVGNELVLKKNSGISPYQIPDGSSETILILEAGENFKPWGDPTSIAKPYDVFGSDHKSPMVGGTHAVYADGSVRFLSENIDPDILKAISTPDGGEVIGEF
ncbi:hypothetical protein Pan241w_34060 [Gimesia alba]|uniref:DUF1559 domain-containing protein n=1 Tax=Gimesia alba TaxID=2527973 RepID=A0A517RHF4_9PLAN|nr:DUF1559 domain-containing protein [Gimesia alba]QDT43306.1 hypothetical protein Pan241w_34060 [Gimesia alba]